jgi:hypothetical protein
MATCFPGMAHPGGLDRKGCHRNHTTGPSTPVPLPTTQERRSALAPDTPDLRGPPVGGRAFRNCDAVRAAGAAPVRRGDPGYGPHLDRDNDGVGCEPYRGR